MCIIVKRIVRPIDEALADYLQRVDAGERRKIRPAFPEDEREQYLTALASVLDEQTPQRGKLLDFVIQERPTAGACVAAMCTLSQESEFAGGALQRLRELTPLGAERVDRLLEKWWRR